MSEAKEKKARPGPPVPPPAIATAALIVRGAAAKVMGLQPGRCGGEMQPIWVTEPAHGKITMSLDGSSRSPFPKEDFHEALLRGVEAVVAEMVSTNAPISCLQMPQSEAKKLAPAALDEKASQGDKVMLAFAKGVTLAELPPTWELCASTGSCGKISFVYGDEGAKKKPDTMILLKKKQVMIRFEVTEPSAPAAAKSMAEKPSAEDVKAVTSGAVLAVVPGVDTDVPQVASKAAQNPQDAEPEVIEEMLVTPFTAKGLLDYDKLMKDYKLQACSADLLKRLEQVAAKRGSSAPPASLHRLLRRNAALAHRDLDKLLTAVEQGKSFYVYTGIGPSSPDLHLGHLLPFTLAKWFQDVFGVAVIVQISDDEKFLWDGFYDADKGSDNLGNFHATGLEVAKEVVALGFDKSKTFIFTNLDYVGHMYHNIVRLWKSVDYGTANPLFALQGDSNIGQSAFPAMQAAPAFPSSFSVPFAGKTDLSCLVICGVDQDPFFLTTRNVAHRLVLQEHPLDGKPAVLHTRFVPSLQRTASKMSSSDQDNALLLSDNADSVKSKVQAAFSGGQQFAKDQREKGADLSKDVPVHLLRYFLDSDEELAKIESEYGSGQGDYWNTAAVKKRLLELVKEILEAHQKRRAAVSSAEVAEWMAVRQLKL
mmetsp:Transcript_64389/g.119713  ORF Transcript_64389/g.119713 Transcript_64389/m.119713 type:complete len:650 (+) Transcript_64389:177-2126(+)